MTSEEKSNLFNEALALVQEDNDEGNLQKLIDKGLEINRKDEYGISLAERAIFGAINYNALHSLWQANASPQTEFVQEIFDEFAKGKTPVEFYEEEKEELKLQNAVDITKGFSCKKLKIDHAFFEINDAIENVQDAELSLTIHLKPFIFNGHYTETTVAFSGVCNPKMKEKIFSETGYTFEDDEIEPSSIYIQHVHNPIELKKLTVKKGKKYYTIQSNLLFNFEYESSDYNNEDIAWEFKVKK